MEFYLYGWDVWSYGICVFMSEKGIELNWIYILEEVDVLQYFEYLGIEMVFIDFKWIFMNISGGQICENLFCYWEYILMEVKLFFVWMVVIFGGELSGKLMLVNKFVNIFNIISVWEYGWDYVFLYFGGDEMVFQYLDYDKIVFGYVQYIDFVVKYVNKVVFIDIDFVSIQVFCLKYEGCEYLFVQVLIDEYCFDLVILLENNILWVVDGLCSFGSLVDCKEFQLLLVLLLKENEIEFVYVKELDYDVWFLCCVELVKQLMGEQGQVFCGLQFLF